MERKLLSKSSLLFWPGRPTASEGILLSAASGHKQDERRQQRPHRHEQDQRPRDNCWRVCRGSLNHVFWVHGKDDNAS